MKRIAIVLTLVLVMAIGSTSYAKDTWIDEDYVQICEEVGYEYGISPELLEAIIEKESSGQADVVNGLGCVGLGQIYEKYHKDRMQKLGVVDLKNPRENITVMADYLLELFEEYEDPYEVLRIYGGWNGTEGEKYITNILERARHLEVVHEKIGAVG